MRHEEIRARFGQIVQVSKAAGNLNNCEKSLNFYVASISNKKEKQHCMGLRTCGYNRTLDFLVLLLFVCLFRPHGMQDLRSLTRDQTCALCRGSVES